MLGTHGETFIHHVPGLYSTFRPDTHHLVFQENHQFAFDRSTS